MIVPEARYAMTVRSLSLAAGGLGGALSTPAGLGQGPGGSPGVGAQGAKPPGSSGNIAFYSTKNGQKTSAFLLFTGLLFS